MAQMLSWIATVIAVATALVTAGLHFWENAAYHQHLEKIDQSLARVAALQTENGFYYSYYASLTAADSTWAGLQEIVWDRRSEYPDTLNALRRFNIYQEVALALIFRLLRALGCASLDAWSLFRYTLYVHTALGQAALSWLSSELSGNPLAGLLCFLLCFLNRGEISRFANHSSADLREHWGIPLLWLQTCCLLQLLRTGGQSSRLARWGFASTTFFFLVSWQFSPFLLLLQATSLYFVVLVAGYTSLRGVLGSILNMYILAIAAAIAIHFGSPYLATSPFLAQLVGLRIATFLRTRLALGGKTSRWALRRFCDFVEGLAAVLLFLATLKAMSPFATADTHVYEILCTKATVVNNWLPEPLRLPQSSLPECTEPSFNARLYLIMGVFNEIQAESLALYRRTFASPLAAAACALLLLRCLLRPLILAGPGVGAGAAAGKETEKEKEKEEGEEDSNRSGATTQAAKAEKSSGSTSGLRRRKDAKPPTSDKPAKPGNKRPHPSREAEVADFDASKMELEEGALLVFATQFLLFSLLGAFVNRLRVAFGPPMMVLASIAASPSLLAWFPFRRSLAWPLRGAALLAFFVVASKISALLPCAGENQGICNHLAEKKSHDGDLADLMEWMTLQLPQGMSVLTSMNLAGSLRPFVPQPLIIHPQFESENLRRRVQRAYELYHCGDEESFAATMHNLTAKVVIFEYARCFFTPYTLDDRGKNCIKGKHEPEDQLCLKLHASAGRFKLLFSNGGYAAFRVQNTTGPQRKPSEVRRRLSDPKTWASFFDRCQTQQREQCGPRLAESAAAWLHGLRRPEVAALLRNTALERFPQDGVVQYYMARYLDYDAKRSREAGKHYELALESLPDNPYVLREYLMWLDLEAKDQNKLRSLLLRKKGRPLLDLQGQGVSELFCEASISAKDLGLTDFSKQLWAKAEQLAPLGKCIRHNWPLQHPESRYEDAHPPWTNFWHFLSVGVTHEIGSHHGPAVRHAQRSDYALGPGSVRRRKNSTAGSGR